MKQRFVDKLGTLDFTSETEVRNFLTDLISTTGIKKQMDVVLLPYSQWKKAKKDGIKDYATKFNSYSEYLKAFATDAVDFYFS